MGMQQRQTKRNSIYTRRILFCLLSFCYWQIYVDDRHWRLRENKKTFFLPSCMYISPPPHFLGLWNFTNVIPIWLDKFTDEWVDSNQLDPRFRPHIRDVALKGHKHHHVKRAKNQRRGSTTLRPLADIMDESSNSSDQSQLLGHFRQSSGKTPRSCDCLEIS